MKSEDMKNRVRENDRDEQKDKRRAQNAEDVQYLHRRPYIQYFKFGRTKSVSDIIENVTYSVRIKKFK